MCNSVFCYLCSFLCIEFYYFFLPFLTLKYLSTFASPVTIHMPLYFIKALLKTVVLGVPSSHCGVMISSPTYKLEVRGSNLQQGQVFYRDSRNLKQCLVIAMFYSIIFLTYSNNLYSLTPIYT